MNHRGQDKVDNTISIHTENAGICINTSAAAAAVHREDNGYFGVPLNG